jgi:hypothetical protein
MNDISLELSDPTVWGKCPKCTASYPGKHVGDYFAKAYPRKKDTRTAEEVLALQKCDNCGGPLDFMYEVR